MDGETIYHLCKPADWQAVAERGVYEGTPQDADDGYIHFSTAYQVAEAAARHFAGERDLMMISVEPETLGEALKWEEAENGSVFPHLYGPLPIEAIRGVEPLKVDHTDGEVVFPFQTHEEGEAAEEDDKDYLYSLPTDQFGLD